MFSPAISAVIVITSSTSKNPSDRVPTGLQWLDQLMEDGLPRQSMVVVGGVPGAGKSTLTFHFMAEAVKNDTNAMLVTTTNQPISKHRRQYVNLSSCGPTGTMDKPELFCLATGVLDATISNRLNTIVGRLRESHVGMVVIDSFRVSPTRRPIGRKFGVAWVP